MIYYLIIETRISSYTLNNIIDNSIGEKDKIKNKSLKKKIEEYFSTCEIETREKIYYPKYIKYSDKKIINSLKFVFDEKNFVKINHVILRPNKDELRVLYLAS